MAWTSVKIAEVAQKIDRSEKVQPDKKYTLLGMRSKIGGPFARETKAGAEISAQSLNRVAVGDFIYSRLFAWQGSFGMVPEELDGCYVSNEFPLFEIDISKIEIKFLVYWFGLLRTQKAVEQQCHGSTPGTRNRFKENFFFGLDAPLPPLEEQHDIVRRLDDVSTLVDKRRRGIEASERETHALLLKAFQRAIDGAPLRPMAEVAPLVRREIEIAPDQAYTEIGVRSFYNGIFHRRTLPGSEFSWQKLFTIKEGDLVFSNLMAWEKAIAVATAQDDGTVGNHRMLTCEVDPAVAMPSFLMAYFRTAEGFASVLGYSPGTIARNKTLSSKKLPTIEVPVPPLESQLWFHRIQEKAREVQSVRERTAKDVGALLPALLHETFSHGASVA